jgi:hypothetical protein
MWIVAAVTFASGAVSAARMSETLEAGRAPDRDHEPAPVMAGRRFATGTARRE